MKGKRLPGGQGNTWTVPFYADNFGDDTKTFGSRAETTLLGSWLGGEGTVTSGVTHVAIPFPCEIERVTVKGAGLAATDQIRIRVRRHLFVAGSTAMNGAIDVISTANTAAPTTVVDYIRKIMTTAKTYFVLDYKGEPLETGTNSTAKGFSEAAITSNSTHLAAIPGATLKSQFYTGDEVTATAQVVSSGDKFSHLAVYVTFARLD